MRNEYNSSVKMNFIYNVGYQILVIILPLITTPYISRVFGPEKLGVYSYTHSVANYFMLFIMLGVANYGNRSVAKIREDRDKLSHTFWSIYLFQFLRGVAVLFIYIAFLIVTKSNYIVIGLIQGLYVLSGVLDISWFFFGLEKFKITVLRNAIIRILNLVLIFVLVRTPDDLWKYTLLMAAGTVVSQAYLWRYLLKFVDIKRVTISSLKEHIMPELILFIPVIAVSIYKIMDRVMLGYLSTMTEVGYYQNTEKIINMPMTIILALGTVMMPRMSNIAANGDDTKSKKYIELSMIFVVFMSCAFTFGFMAVAPVFSPVFFGGEFDACIKLLEWLSVTTIFISWANVIRTQYLIPNEMDKSFIISVSLGAVVNVIINSLLIPQYAAFGAVLGTIVAEAVVCICQTLMVWKYLDIKKYLLNGFPFLIIGYIMYLIVRYVGNVLGISAMSLIIEIIVGILVYTPLSVVYLYFCKKDVLLGLTKPIVNKLKKV